MKNWILSITLAVFAWQSVPAQNTGELVRQLNDAFADVYERVAPAVVVIEVKPSRGQPVINLPQGLDFFFRRPDGGRIPMPSEQGSGFIVSPQGVIITNNHVVESGDDGEITVRLRDGRKFKAQLLGRDEKSDLAVLKIEAEDLPTVELADSDAVRVGQFAFAIGAPFDLPYTFTVGVVSAKARNNLTRSTSYEEYIQTDAAINPGNSGGPLCDIEGRVIGVNTLISGLNRGLGFAVPINIAKDVSAQLIEHGKVSRPWLGIGIVGLDEDDQSRLFFPGVDRGVVVKSIEFNTPAYHSTLRAGDVIVKVDGEDVAYASDLQREILSKSVGQNVRLDVWRAGRVVPVTVRTGEQPEPLIRASSTIIPIPMVPAPRSGQPMPQPPRPQAPQWVPQDSAPPGIPSLDESLFGLTVADVGGGKGARVLEVIRGSQGDVAGFRPGDVIGELAGKPVKDRSDFVEILKEADLRRGVMALIDREGQKTFAILKQ